MPEVCSEYRACLSFAMRPIHALDLQRVRCAPYFAKRPIHALYLQRMRCMPLICNACDARLGFALHLCAYNENEQKL